MLKSKIVKKVSIICSAILVILIVTIFPKENQSILVHKKTNQSGIIYLLDNNDYVASLNIVFDSFETNELIEEIISTLTINNVNSKKIRNGFKAVIPENTKLINYEIKDENVLLNFSREFLNISSTLEEKMIEAIVYSLTSLKDISSVTIKVENVLLEKLPNSNKILPSILDRTMKINKEYDIETIDDIKSTTIYHLAKYNDFVYYVPVTKINNDKKEKIEIIIEELKSSSSYNTNLVNYLNQETKLSNYEILDNSIILNLSNQMFNEFNSNTLTEEVTYAINLSVKDNYNIDDVIYYVDDKPINF